MAEKRSWKDKKMGGNTKNKGNDQEGSEPKGQGEGQGYLDEASLNYYKRVLSMLEEGFPDEEEKGIFLKNVFKTLSLELVPASRHCRTSWTVQKLLAEADRNQYLLLFTIFTNDLERVCSDRFSSHVIQELVALIPKFMKEDSSNESEEHKKAENVLQNKKKLFEIDTKGDDLLESCTKAEWTDSTENKDITVLSFKECFDSLCSYIRGNLKKFLTDVYASHIVRVFLHVLGGVSVAPNLERSQFSRKESKRKEVEMPDTSHEVVPEWVTILSEITEDVLSMKNLSDLIFNSVSNPVLQTLLLVLHKSNHRLSDRCWNVLVVSADLDNVDPESGLPAALTDKIASHLIQQCLKLANTDQCSYIMTNYLQGKVFNMGVHHVANYVLQTLTECAPVDKFEAIYQELKLKMEDILAHNRVGVITALVKRSVELQAKQKKLLKVLLKAFHCSADDRKLKCVPVMTALTTYETYFNIPEDGADQDTNKTPPLLSSENINLHGSLIVQSLLQMPESSAVVSSFLDLQPKEIHNLSVSVKGCHIVEAFLRSPCVEEDSVNRFINYTKKQFTELSCNKYGSRIMDALWVKATLQQKEIIAKELIKHSTKLQNDFQGKFIFRNFSLYDFQNNLNVWREAQSGGNKRSGESTTADGHKKKKQKKK